MRDLRAALPKGLARQINAIPKLGVVYVTNQKAACSTIKLMLLRAESGDVALNPAKVHGKDVFAHPRDIGWPVVLGMLSGSAFRFTFVRHPVARLLSAYADKLVRQRHAFAPLVNAALGRDADAQTTLDDFLDAIEAQAPVECDPHWRAQHLNILHDVIGYDLVGRVESFAADIATVPALAGIPVDAKNVNVKFPPPAPTAAQVRRIEHIYARDFELFGY